MFKVSLTLFLFKLFKKKKKFVDYTNSKGVFFFFFFVFDNKFGKWNSHFSLIMQESVLGDSLQVNLMWKIRKISCDGFFF